ncbi:ankyrin repeat domain-containing protein [Wolbachia endosymbiont (group B) of Xestia c-nigrum]|uniref:ankyrin repeat domain-containing protein n=1 Tax=Wolbachia endosymbiont (group B) of Xestia c-nigrum TaxID=2954067 RepID=UPI0022264578|nr:ankyrin repeat domain-containing protein [Wolbachia endosymbiont (group B) of Xestia c-nigrum]
MPETYPAWGRKRSLHGDIYQLKWVMLLLKRAVDVGYSFRLATEMESATGFDDIVFQDRKNEKIVHRFIQNKHKQNECEKIGVGKLLSKNKSGEFSVPKYFVSYLKIKINPDFADGDLKDFTICTNIGFDLAQSTTQNTIKKLKAKTSGPNKGIEIAVEVISTSDIFFKYGGTRYKFSCTHDNMISIVQPAFKSAVKEAIEELEKEIKELQGKSDQNSKRKLERNQVWQREFERMTNEGKLEENIREFFDKLVFAVNQPNEIKLAEIIENELGKEFNNIDKKNVYGRFLVEVLDWMKAREGKFLSHEEINEFFEKIREEILGAVWFDVRGPVRLFTGRDEELGMLHDSLQRNPKGAVISYITSISGPGGMGKSQLARKYACKYRRYYDDNVIWIDAENFEAMKDSFLRLARNRLGISPKDKYGNDKTIETIVREVYAFFARRRSLFIFDNVQEYKKISKFLPFSLSPDLNKPHILITSHDQELEKGIDVIKLGELEQRDAIEFVKKGFNILKKDKSQDREIENLVRRLQCFPLAIQQAISYIEDQRIIEKFKISDYLKEYEKKAKKLLKSKIFQGIDNNYTKTTFTAWEVTMDKVRSDEQYGPLASEILDVLAYFAPDKIAREIFLNSVSDYKKKQLKLAIRLLVRYSMVGGEQNQSVLNIHSLVQKVTRLKLQENRQEEEVLRKALELINSGGLAQGSMSHIAFVWGYASTYGKLIDNFYFNSFYVYGGTLFIRKSTPLHLLAESGDCKAISAIITHIEKYYPGELVKIVNVKDNHGQTLLHIAAKSGNLNVMKCLVNKGASTNTKDKYDNTPLHSAAYYAGELDIVKYLIIKNNNINAKGEYGRTPLHIAAINGDLDMVEYLIKRYANIDAKDNCGMTPLHLAADVGELGIVEHLINEDAYVDARDEHYRSPLFFAAENGKLNVVKCLIEKGANVNAKNEYGETALHRVVYKATFSGDLRIVEFLINKGANVNARDRNSRTLLHYSALSGSCNIAECLIREGANINAKDKDGNTTLGCY